MRSCRGSKDGEGSYEKRYEKHIQEIRPPKKYWGPHSNYMTADRCREFTEKANVYVPTKKFLQSNMLFSDQSFNNATGATNLKFLYTILLSPKGVLAPRYQGAVLARKQSLLWVNVVYVVSV